MTPTQYKHHLLQVA